MARTVAVTMTEKVDENDAVAPCGKRIRKPVVMGAGEEQPVNENNGSRTRTTFLKCDSEAFVVKRVHV